MNITKPNIVFEDGKLEKKYIPLLVELLNILLKHTQDKGYKKEFDVNTWYIDMDPYDFYNVHENNNKSYHIYIKYINQQVRFMLAYYNHFDNSFSIFAPTSNSVSYKVKIDINKCFSK